MSGIIPAALARLRLGYTLRRAERDEIVDQLEQDRRLAEAFRDVIREWVTEPGPMVARNKLAGSSAISFVAAVSNRAAEYAKR
jgi:hypothetical protein